MNVKPPVYIAGLDLGRPHEFTALAVLERTEVPIPDEPSAPAASLRGAAPGASAASDAVSRSVHSAHRVVRRSIAAWQ